MAIDAELAQGSLDARSAQQERRKLALESQFYGAMDGGCPFGGFAYLMQSLMA